MYRSLAQFVDALHREGELLRIRQPVSPVLAIAAAADEASKRRAPRRPSDAARSADPINHDRGGPALLFENVEGSDTPVLINAFGSYRRMEMALGCEAGGFEEIAARIGALVKPEPPKDLRDAIAMLKRFAPLAKVSPKRSRRLGACQQVVRTGADIDLTRLPFIRCWPHDGDAETLGYPPAINAGVEGLGHPDVSDDEWEARFRGRYLTLGGIHTIHADDAGAEKPSSHNIGMYRVQLLGKNRVAMHWHIHHDGAAHWRSWKRIGKPMPVAIVLGGESVLPYASTAPLPPGISELLMAGFLNGGGIRLCRAQTVPLWVPAEAEIVIEGWVRTDAGGIGWDPRETDEPLGPGAVFEGPFGDHTGFYSMPDRYPIVEVSAVTSRQNPVFPATVVGLPPQEDYFLGKATERVFFPLLKTLIPDIEDYDLPMFGAFHNCAVLKIEKHYALQGRRAMHSVWGAGQMAWTKFLFVVDGETDVHDWRAVLRAASARCSPAFDVEKVRGPLDILDHAAPVIGAGTKAGFDATQRWAGEREGGGTSGWTRPDGSVVNRVLGRVRGLPRVRSAIWPEDLGGWLFVWMDKQAPGQGRELAHEVRDLAIEHGASAPPFVVIVDGGPEDAEGAMFRWCANSDTGRDATWWESGGASGVIFDATAKQSHSADESDGQPVRAWPPILDYPDGVRADAARLLADYPP